MFTISASISRILEPSPQGLISSCLDNISYTYTVKNYLHGLHGFVANSQKFVVCNRPRENPKRSKFPWSKLQTVCTKLYSYIVLYYAKFGVKSGKSQLETKLGPKYKCNIQNYKVYVLLAKTFVTEDYFLCLPMYFLYYFVLHKIIS